MATINWDETGKRFYETGIDHVVLYKGGQAVAWNGVTAVNEAPTGAEITKQYADNIDYFALISKEEFGLTLEAFSAPKLFNSCEGIVSLKDKCSSLAAIFDDVLVTGQARDEFGLSYRTLIGNDQEEAGTNEQDCIIHVVYNCRAGVSSKDHATINDSPEAATLSWEITTTNLINSTGVYPAAYKGSGAAHLEIDCSKLTSAQYGKLKEALYGTASASVTSIPTPKALYEAVTYTPTP